MRRQQGMIVIVPVVLLLGIVAASCTVTLQSVSLMARFSQHVQHSLQLRSEREQQLQYGVTLARANTHKDVTLALPTNVTLHNKAQRKTHGVLLTLYEFSYAQHHLQGGLAVLNFPLIRNIPPAGLMLFSPLASGSAFNIALMPTVIAGQSGSLWSPFAITLHGARKTCLITSPLIPPCTAPLLSGNGTKALISMIVALTFRPVPVNFCLVRRRGRQPVLCCPDMPPAVHLTQTVMACTRFRVAVTCLPDIILAARPTPFY